MDVNLSEEECEVVSELCCIGMRSCVDKLACEELDEDETMEEISYICNCLSIFVKVLFKEKEKEEEKEIK